MVRKKCLGCANLLTMSTGIECCYTTYGAISDCPCADCMLKSMCTVMCLDFINKFLKYEYREQVFDSVLKRTRHNLLEGKYEEQI